MKFAIALLASLPFASAIEIQNVRRAWAAQIGNERLEYAQQDASEEDSCFKIVNGFMIINSSFPEDV
jgi:hypothetical protein